MNMFWLGCVRVNNATHSAVHGYITLYFGKHVKNTLKPWNARTIIFIIWSLKTLKTNLLTKSGMEDSSHSKGPSILKRERTRKPLQVNSFPKAKGLSIDAVLFRDKPKNNGRVFCNLQQNEKDERKHG